MSNLRESKAFTLIEVMVVIVIVGIIAAIAVFAFKGDINKENRHCDGPNMVYEGYDVDRPPTVVPNDPRCTSGAG